MPTFIKTGFWEKKAKGFQGWLNLDSLIQLIAQEGSSVNYIDVTTSRSILETDNNATLKVKGNVTLTVPTGLPDNFTCYIDVWTGFTLTWVASGVTFSGNDGLIQTENSVSLLYKDGATTTFRLIGEV